MYSNGWNGEKWRLIGTGLAAYLLGAISGYWAYSALLCLCLYLAWHLFQLYKVEHWLRNNSDKENPPRVSGAYSEIGNHVLRLHKRQKKLRRRQKFLTQRFEDIAIAAPDATLIINSHGEVLWANDAAEQDLGIANPRDIGQRIGNLIDDTEFTHFIQQADNNAQFNMLSPRNNEQHLNLRISAYHGDEMLITARDISELVLASEMRRDFVNNASHELKTPLTVMSGYLELLEDDPSLSTDIKPLLSSVSEQTIRMRSLVDDLLTLSRLDSGRQHSAEPIAVADMLTSIVSDALHLRGQADSGFIDNITLEVNADRLLEGVYQDIFSAFSNLIFNAVAHTPVNAPIHISWNKEGGSLVLRVTDSGPGIEAQHLSRLTERFYRAQAGRERDSNTAASGRGTGLGLAIVKHIMQSHGGRLEISSTIGKGSTFSCIFPVQA